MNTPTISLKKTFSDVEHELATTRRVLERIPEDRHRGQLSVFLHLLDIPVPSIYGPSADEAS